MRLRKRPGAVDAHGHVGEVIGAAAAEAHAPHPLDALDLPDPARDLPPQAVGHGVEQVGDALLPQLHADVDDDQRNPDAATESACSIHVQPSAEPDNRTPTRPRRTTREDQTSVEK